MPGLFGKQHTVQVGGRDSDMFSMGFTEYIPLLQSLSSFLRPPHHTSCGHCPPLDSGSVSEREVFKLKIVRLSVAQLQPNTY